MAKNQGFAALAALQNKNVTVDETKDVPESEELVKTPEPSEGDLPEFPDEESETRARGQTSTLIQMDELPYLGTEPESFASESKETNIAAQLNAVIERAQPVFDAPVEEVIEQPEARDLNTIPVVEWTDTELEEYITGITKVETYVATLKEAVTEHRKRYNVMAKAWTVEECRAFLLTGTVPAKTSKGAWVNDVTRKFRREHEWETNELESWALGEIKAEGATTDGGLAVELKHRLNLPLKSVDVQAVITNYRFTTAQVTEARVEQRPEPQTQTVTEERVAEVTKAIQLEGVTPVNQSYIDSSLAQFEAVMKPGRAITEKSSGDAQRLLRDVILYAIQLPDPVGVRSAMQYLLEYFRARRGIGQIFEDTYAFRGIPDMRGTKKEQVAHHDLLTVFLVYADPMVELRAQTDVPSLIGNVNPQFQSRVLEFFARQ